MGSRQDASAALVLEPVAFARDLNDRRVMQYAIEHGRREHGIAGEGFVPTAERQVRRQDQRALFVTPRDNLKEQTRLLASKRQIADFVDDQKFGTGDHPVHDLFDAALPVGGLQRDDEVGSAGEANLPAALDRQQAKGNRKVRLAGAARAQQDDILGAHDEPQRCEFLDLLASRQRRAPHERAPVAKAKS